MIAVLLLLGCHGAVEDGASAFGQGEVDRARDLWTDAAESGPPSGVLLYDLGDAWYRNGDIARAIAAWRGARELRPRDSAVQHNLALARSQLEGVPEPAGPPMAWLDLATPGEVGVLGSVLLAIASAGAWWRRRTPPEKRDPERMASWGAPWLLVGLLGAVLGVAAIAGWRATVDHPIAVVVDAEAAARDAAMAEAKVRFRLPGGSEVLVDREQGAFLLVRTGEGQHGWVPKAALVVVAP